MHRPSPQYAFDMEKDSHVWFLRDLRPAQATPTGKGVDVGSTVSDQQTRLGMSLVSPEGHENEPGMRRVLFFSPGRRILQAAPPSRLRESLVQHHNGACPRTEEASR